MDACSFNEILYMQYYIAGFDRCDLWPYLAHQVFLQIKFYWSIATSTHLHNIHGCFHMTTAEVSS